MPGDSTDTWSKTVQWFSATQAGNSVIVYVEVQGSTANFDVRLVSDDTGNAFTQLSGPNVLLLNGRFVDAELWSCASCAPANALVVSASGSAGSGGLSVWGK
jgi:hypothetical protein